MSKQDYIMQGRNEGIAFCDKIAKEKGLEELQRVTRQRNLAGLRTLIDPRELDQDLEMQHYRFRYCIDHESYSFER